MILLKPKPFLGFKAIRFIDPDTNFKFKADNIDNLCKHITQYREQNGLEPLLELPLVVQNYLCSLPENLGVCEPERYKLKRGLFKTIQGGIALIKTFMYSKFVDQSVADARSSICKDCSLNVFPDRGAFIVWADKIAVGSVGERKSKYHESLGNCAGCSCPLRSKVWYAGAITLKDVERKTMLEANPRCWQILGTKNG